MPISALTRFRQDEDGAAAVIASLLLVVLFGFVALGVDVASLYRQRAQLQSDSDLTVLSAMAVPDAATGRAEYALTRNGRSADTLQTIETGRFLRNPALPADARFIALPTGSAGINAVRVVLRTDAPLHFARVFSDETHIALDRASLATRTGTASFSLDSHIVNLDWATLNRALTQTYGVNAAINLGSLQVLADTSVNLGGLLESLAEISGNTSRNPAEILNGTTTGAELIAALRASLPASLSSALSGLQTAVGNASFTVYSLVGGIDSDLGLTASEAMATVDIVALDVVSALIAAHTMGETLTLETEAVVDGVISAQTSITAGEPAAQSELIAMGEEGAQLHRAAVRLRSDIELVPSLLGNLGIGIQVASVNLPIYIEVAGATATLDQIGCNVTDPDSVAARFSTAASPLNPTNGTSVAALYLGALPMGTGAIDPADLDFADIISVDIEIDLGLLGTTTIPGVTLQARSKVAVGASMSETIIFSVGEVADGTITKTYGSGLMLSTLVADLLSPATTELRVKPGQGGQIGGLAASVVATLLDVLPDRLLSTLATPLDGVLDGTLGSLGIELGVGQLELMSHNCEPIRLVR